MRRKKKSNISPKKEEIKGKADLMKQKIYIREDQQNQKLFFWGKNIAVLTKKKKETQMVIEILKGF